jgi:hypothetical protein
MRRLAAFALLVSLACGCGGAHSASSILSDTASSLDQIKSGTLGFDLLVTPKRSGSRPFGFKLNGPFSTRGGGLPVTRATYTQIANGKSATVTLISTGNAGFITVRGKTYELPADRLAPLRSATAVFGGNGRSLPLDDWIQDAKVAKAGSIGGEPTDHVRGRLDLARAVGDLGALTPGGKPLNARERGQLERAARTATIDVWSGKKDHLLRKLAIDVDLRLDVPAELRAALGDLVGARLQVTLAVRNPNRPVSVTAPAGALPYSALASR